jgi:hypothetical protein
MASYDVARRQVRRPWALEKRELERLEANMYNEVRQCSEVHREARVYTRPLFSST